jgi:GH15 family glucan-1,4-alpha-glucosidase
MSRIEDYALLGDLHSAALVGRNGSIDWMCLPRFDSPACFAALLDTPDAGRWILAPAAGGTCTSRAYRGDTLVLDTEWTLPGGRIRVVDFMKPRDQHPRLVRIVEGLAGAVDMRSEIRLRFDYGHVVPWVRHRGTGVEAVAGPDAVWLHSTVPQRGEQWSTVSRFTVRAGDQVPFVLSWAPSHEQPPGMLDAGQALYDTVAFWQNWVARGRLPSRYRDAVCRSLITLKALTYLPTGGIVAAATTSLPEQVGGPRNWDYRYCWLRDATLTLQALLSAGYRDEATAWREWLLRAVAGKPGELQIMYDLHGRRRLPETEIGWLSGYEKSTPVRIGNAAAGQLQLDVWGEVLDGLAFARDAGLNDRHDAWDLQLSLMEHLEGQWDQPDNGLWEMRGPRRQFTHSKVMAWVAADRMVTAIRAHGLGGPVERWEALRDQIHQEVCRRGVDAEHGNFTQAYDSPALDASLLQIPRVRFLPPDDPRVVATIDAIQRDLTDDGLVLRYRSDGADDGLPGGEGVFVACSFWLVDALHGAGRVPEATALFERLLTLRNDVGLFSEEWDTAGQRQLGNTPQAFSHFPLVVSAGRLDGPPIG